MNLDLKKSSDNKKESGMDQLRDANNIYYHKKVLHCYDQATQDFTQINEGVFHANSNRKMHADLDD
jgi:maltose-binding protein MalE